MEIPTYFSWHASTHSREEQSMEPTTVCCPNGHGQARGQIGQGNIGIHARKEQRFICHECHNTFAACYSGKKKDHTVKNVLLVNALLLILFLSDTYGGRTHD